jgi:hypothetical protein
VTPDSILKTLTAIAEIEEKMPLKRSMRVA